MNYEVYTPYSFMRNRNQYLFENLEDVASYFSYEIYCYDNFGDTIRIIDCYDRQRVDPNIVLAISKRLRHKRIVENEKRRYGNYEFRNGPVPKIHKRRWRRVKGPHTFQRVREAFMLDIDEDVRYYNIKFKSSDKHLPNSWDDFRNTSYGNHNWKRFRNNQWK